MYLDKSRDGRQWIFQSVRGDGIVLRWSFDYHSFDAVAHTTAEVGVYRGGEIEWTRLGTFEMFLCGMDSDPCSGWIDVLPDIWREEFTEFGRRLGEIVRLVELGATEPRAEDPPDVEAFFDETVGGKH
jgi:hypothetical protein